MNKTCCIHRNSAEQRVALLKSFSDLQHLPKNSSNIEGDSVLKEFKRRPKNLNDCMLILCPGMTQFILQDKINMHL